MSETNTPDAARGRLVRIVTASLLALGPAISSARPASAHEVEIVGNIQAELAISPGQQLAVGYHVSLPTAHPSATVAIRAASAVLVVTCPDGWLTSIMVPLPDASLEIPTANSDWFPPRRGDPSGDEREPAVYQGELAAPDVCLGQSYLARDGAIFVADVASTDPTDLVSFQFHYTNLTTDPGQAGAWSPVATILPGGLATVTPTPELPTSTTIAWVSPTPTDTPAPTSLATQSSTPIPPTGTPMPSNTPSLSLAAGV